MISSEDFNEACTNGEEEAIALINSDGPKQEAVTVTATTVIIATSITAQAAKNILLRRRAFCLLFILLSIFSP